MTFAALLLGCFFAVCGARPPQDAPVPSVGVSAVLGDQVLPGGELEVLPVDSLSPLVLRISAARPHGDGWRYDFEFWGRDPGEYDLRDHLRRRDGSDLRAGADALPPIPVTVASLLPAGRVLPNTPPGGRVPDFGGYRTLGWLAAAVWFVGLLAILVGGRRRAAQSVAAARPRSLAEVLRPLVERAMAGALSAEERSRLELGLVALWRRRLDLEALRPEEVLARLREHAEAGPLLTSLETWLHRPGSAREVDLRVLLAPYRDLPPEALERVLAEA